VTENDIGYDQKRSYPFEMRGMAKPGFVSSGKGAYNWRNQT